MDGGSFVYVLGEDLSILVSSISICMQNSWFTKVDAWSLATPMAHYGFEVKYQTRAVDSTQ